MYKEVCIKIKILKFQIAHSERITRYAANEQVTSIFLANSGQNSPSHTANLFFSYAKKSFGCKLYLGMEVKNPPEP